MAFVKKTWLPRQTEFPGRRELTDTTTGAVQTVDVDRAEGTIIEEGDAFSAANMNGLENRIETAIASADSAAAAASTAAAAAAATANSALTTANAAAAALPDKEQKRLAFYNVYHDAGWYAADSTYPSYPYRGLISFPAATSAMIPDVIFSPDDAASGNFASVAIAYDTCVAIYAKTPQSVTIPTIILWR